MSDIKVRDLDTTAVIQNDNSLLTLTDENNNTVKRISFQRLMQNEISADSGNTLDLGTDNKLFSQPRISQLADVELTNLQDGETIVYNETTQKFENSQSVGGWYPSLLQPFWSDKRLNRMDMLLADTFSWQDGTTYSGVYTHLEDDIDGKILQSETIGSTTVQFYLADDGDKICPASEESNVLSIYSATGIAWYYILDTDNTQFKLPRTQYGFVGLRDEVGKFVPQDVLLPDITGRFDHTTAFNPGTANGAFTYSNYSNASNSGSYSQRGYITFSASNSSSVYSGDGTNTNIQQKSTQMYLYFYVGEYSQTAIEQTAGLNAELFNNKVDLNGNNATFSHIIEEYENGTSGYRIWSNGYCVQWGEIVTSSQVEITITFLKTFKNTNYIIFKNCPVNASNNMTFRGGNFYSYTTTSAKTYAASTSTPYDRWKASGYLADGQY